MASLLKHNVDHVLRQLRQQEFEVKKRAIDLQIAIATRLMELLIERTPVKTGELVGGWTVLGGIDGRLNPTRVMPIGERSAIVSRARRGVSISIDNAVEYVRVLNDGLRGNEPRQFAELSIAQLNREFANSGIDIEIN